MSAPWFKFYPSDWRADPALRMCSIGARGLWMEMLCVMHEAEPRGSLLVNGNPVSERQLAGLAGCSLKDVTGFLDELEAAGVFSRDNGIIYSRRMRRDDEKAARDKANGKAGGHPEIRRGTVPKDERVRRFRRSDAPAKAKRIFDRSSGTCHWCQKRLDPDHYHIDHVIAVRDGGTNDESNLVAACPDCNGERAMTWGRNDSDLMVGTISDHKAQKPEARSQSSDADASDARADDAPIPPTGVGMMRRAEIGSDRQAFDQFWHRYPHKVGKQDAAKAFAAAMKRGGVTLDVMLAALDRYIRTKPPDRAWCNPGTWLRQGRWEDDPGPDPTSQRGPARGPSGASQRIAAMAEILAERRECGFPAEDPGGIRPHGEPAPDSGGDVLPFGGPFASGIR